MHVANQDHKADRRKSPRVRLTESHVSIAGEIYSLRDWSREGALVSDYNGGLSVGESTDIKLEINTARGLLVINGHAEVARKQDTALGLRWFFQTVSDTDDHLALVNFFLHDGTGDAAL
jgi:hypothetical protein